MRAVVVRNYDGPEALEIIDVPVPEPGRGQVRIRVEAAAVNPVDIATREGLMNVARPGVIRERSQVGTSRASSTRPGRMWSASRPESG